MRFDAYSVWCGQRCQAACTTTCFRLSMSPSIYLCVVGDIRAIVNYVCVDMVNKDPPQAFTGSRRLILAAKGAEGESVSTTILWRSIFICGDIWLAGCIIALAIYSVI
jgi:hypothetical protein